MHMRWLFPGHHWHFGRSCDTQFENWETKKSWTYPRFQQTNAKRCYRRRKTDTQGKKKKQLSGTFLWTTHATFTCANCPSFPDKIKDILILGLPVMKIIDILHLLSADNYLFDSQPILNFDDRKLKKLFHIVLIISHMFPDKKILKITTST